jgi:hypothetical protein
MQCLLTLIGVELPLGDSAVRVGPAEVLPLLPMTRLASRIVVIKGFQEPAAFVDAANRQLIALGIHAEAGNRPSTSPKPIAASSNVLASGARSTANP